MMHFSETPNTLFQQYINQNRPPVIMQVVPALNGGGVEQGVVDMNAAIVNAGGQSIVVSSGGQKVHEIERAGGVHITMPVHSKNPITMARNVTRLKDLINQHRVDLVHACSRAPAWSAFKAAKTAGVRYVTSCHAAHNISGRVKRFYNSAIAKGERVIVVSHFLSEYLQQNYHTDPAKIRVIHRGVSMGKFHPNCVTPERLINLTKSWRLPDGASVIMMPGRITRSKGHLFLIDALAELNRDDIFCVFMGKNKKNSSYRKELEDYIEAKGMSGKVRMVENCTDMPAAYMLSTVVVCPSIEPEGFGRIPIEAQAMGRPAISTEHGGAMETIVKDETGWLVQPHDVPALAQALGEAMTLDNERRAVLGTRAMSHVAQYFSLEVMCQATLDVYAELLGVNAKQAVQPSELQTPEAVMQASA